MADVKNFGIRGIGADVQFGKSGGRVVYDSGNSLFKVTTDGTTLGNVDVATPTADTHAANKSYVDSVASGLDVKDSVNSFQLEKSRTIGISKSNLDFFNKYIINIDKITWKLRQIHIFSDNLKKEKLLNFENSKNPVFWLIFHCLLFH